MYLMKIRENLLKTKYLIGKGRRMMNKLKITTDYLNKLKLSLQDEYDNSSVSPEDRYELKTIEEIDGVLEELRRVKEQGEE